jgi:hypothetical protein
MASVCWNGSVSAISSGTLVARSDTMATIISRACLSCGAALAASKLVCDHCGAAHVMAGDGLAFACTACGAGNRTDATSCAQCRAALVVRCPECLAQSPLGARFCQACQLELAAYRRPLVQRVRCRIGPDAIEKVVLDWLELGWFSAGDVRREAKILDRALVWIPVWRFGSRVEGVAQGAVSQTHYRTVTKATFAPRPGEPTTEVGSEPYKVWVPATKNFAREVAVDASACDVDGLDDTLWEGGGLLGGARRLREMGESTFDVVPGPTVGDLPPLEAHERVFEPDDPRGHETFARQKARAREIVKREVLERVDSLEARWLRPSLRLVFLPVWRVVYRYKRSSGDVRVHGVTGHAEGTRMSILNRLFS